MKRRAHLAATEPAQVAPVDLLALLIVAESLERRFYQDTELLKAALAGGSADAARTVYDAVHARIMSCTCIVEGLVGKQAIRNFLFLLIEEVASLTSSEAVTPLQSLQRKLIAAHGPVAYVRAQLGLIAPSIERRAPDGAIRRALDICTSAGPGKRGVAETKASALAKVWKEMGGETVDAHSFESSLSKARSASRKPKP